MLAPIEDPTPPPSRLTPGQVAMRVLGVVLGLATVGSTVSVAFAVAGVIAFGAALRSGCDGSGGGLTGEEMGVIAALFGTCFVVTWGVVRLLARLFRR